jgi:hypothetical protein
MVFTGTPTEVVLAKSNPGRVEETAGAEVSRVQLYGRYGGQTGNCALRLCRNSGLSPFLIVQFGLEIKDVLPRAEIVRANGSESKPVAGGVASSERLPRLA